MKELIAKCREDAKQLQFGSVVNTGAIAKTLNAAADALEAREWVSVDTWLPDVGQSVLVLWHSGGQSVIEEWDDYDGFLKDAKAWQPTPPPPES